MPHTIPIQDLVSQLDIPVKDVKVIMDTMDSKAVLSIFKTQLHRIDGETKAIKARAQVMKRCLAAVSLMPCGGQKKGFIKAA